MELAELRGRLEQRYIQIGQLKVGIEAKDTRIYTLKRALDIAFMRFDTEWMELPLGRER